MSTLCSVVSAASAQLSALLSSLAPREIYYIGGPEPLPAPLTPAEEQALLARLDTDGAAVRTTLIEHNLRLVVFIARKFDNTGIMLEDLISIGTIGLIKAVNTFDPSKKIKLATYASRCIENEILMFLRKTSQLRNEVSIDDPLNVDWDGNELLLSDVLGSEQDAVNVGIEQEVERSLLLAAEATIICLVLAFPVGYFLSRLRANKQHIMLMLVMLPMWMNFLLRTYAWMTLLEKNGLINKLLGLFGIGPFNMINTSGAVVLGMVYNYLPYMILPLYTAMTKIDNSVVEAAQDLGANVFQILGRVLIPLSKPGIATGITMVFVPAVSTFIISRMLGGGANLLIGDLIELQFLGNSYNLNLGSAMSLVLMVIVLLCMSFTSSFDEEEMEGVM